MNLSSTLETLAPPRTTIRSARGENVTHLQHLVELATATQTTRALH